MKSRPALQPDIERSVPDPQRVQIAPLTPGLVVIRTIATFLSVSVTKVEDLVRQGLPYVDVGEHHPKRRLKRCLRFHPASVLEWILRERGRNGPPGAPGDR